MCECLIGNGSGSLGPRPEIHGGRFPEKQRPFTGIGYKGQVGEIHKGEIHGDGPHQRNPESPEDRPAPSTEGARKSVSIPNPQHPDATGTGRHKPVSIAHTCPGRDFMHLNQRRFQTKGKTQRIGIFLYRMHPEKPDSGTDPALGQRNATQRDRCIGKMRRDLLMPE
jgi:hypothetical protein